MRTGTRWGLIPPCSAASPPAWLLDFFLCVLVSKSGTDPSGLPALHPPALHVYVPVNGPLQTSPAAEREPASHLELRLPQNVYGARSRNETTSILLTGPKHYTHSWPACWQGPRAWQWTATAHPAKPGSEKSEKNADRLWGNHTLSPGGPLANFLVTLVSNPRHLSRWYTVMTELVWRKDAGPWAGIRSTGQSCPRPWWGLMR